MAMIRIYTDEHVDPAIAEGLRREGVEAWSTRDAKTFGWSDEQQLEYAATEHAVLFTHNTDFIAIGQCWEREGKEQWSIIYTHLKRWRIGVCIRRLKEVAEIVDADAMRNCVEYL